MGFLEGRDARILGPASEAERREAVVGTFTRLFGDRAANPIGYAEKDWSSEPFSRGCYAGVPTPGTWTAYGRALREPVGPHPLGGHRDRDALDGLLRRRDPGGEASGRRGAGCRGGQGQRAARGPGLSGRG